MLPSGERPRSQDWDVVDLTMLVALRARGARERRSAVEQAGLEAHTFEGKGCFGVVVDTTGKCPKPVAIVYDQDDYRVVLDRPDFKNRKHVLVVSEDHGLRA